MSNSQIGLFYLKNFIILPKVIKMKHCDCDIWIDIQKNFTSQQVFEIFTTWIRKRFNRYFSYCPFCGKQLKLDFGDQRIIKKLVDKLQIRE